MNIIKLIGIEGDYDYAVWQEHLKTALQELEISIHLETVNDIDAIIELKAGAIPALILNDQILLEQNGHIPEAQEIKQAILASLG